MLKDILLSFIPLFIAVDAIGVMPMFVGLTSELEQKAKTRIIVQSMLTAACLAVGFVLGGKLLFRWLGITIGDFMIAGGAILFSLAIIDLVNPVNCETIILLLQGSRGTIRIPDGRCARTFCAGSKKERETRNRAQVAHRKRNRIVRWNEQNRRSLG